MDAPLHRLEVNISEHGIGKNAVWLDGVLLTGLQEIVIRAGVEDFTSVEFVLGAVAVTGLVDAFAAKKEAS